MIRIFIKYNTIYNVDNDIDAQKLLATGAWEMPQDEVTRIFGDKANLAWNGNTEITLNDTGYNIIFTPPVEDLKLVKDAKVQEAIIAYNNAIDNIAKDYPVNEKLTFEQQLTQAQNVMLDNKEDIEVVKGIAFGRQITIEELAPKIMIKNKAFQYPAGVYLGRKQRVQDLVEKAKTVEEVNAIDVQAIFAEPLV